MAKILEQLLLTMNMVDFPGYENEKEKVAKLDLKDQLEVLTVFSSGLSDLSDHLLEQAQEVE